MTHAEFASELRRINLTTDEIADRMLVTPATVRGWLRGQTMPRSPNGLLCVLRTEARARAAKKAAAKEHAPRTRQARLRDRVAASLGALMGRVSRRG